MIILVNDLINDNNQNEIRNKDIMKSKNIICPKCKENIKMDIKDYKINLYECLNGHKIENILLNEFERTQNIDLLNILCDICKKNNKSISFNNIFYKCLTCEKNICPLCKSSHNDIHNIINYDNKYYICNRHNENYISYCEECKINICTLCDNHKTHKRINFLDILPKKEDLIEKINTLKYYINIFNNEINMLINILNEVKTKINTYYKINEEILNNYDIKNRNYETLYYLNQFQKNNNIINELIEIIESQSILDKFNKTFNIYRTMNIDEITLIYKVKDLKGVQLFGKDFVERNKNNCSLIIDGKEQELKTTYIFGLFFASYKDIFEVKLKGITNITDISYMFFGCVSLLSLPDISKWNTSNITNMSYLFYWCSLPSLPDISTWDTSNVINMSYMFYWCNSLLSLPDISKWNTSNVTNMSGMFYECESLTSFPDISNWNTSNIINISYMFAGCKSILSLPDISKWNTSNIIDMSFMFYGCNSLISLPDISKWNTSNISDMHNMFYESESLSSLPDISIWNIPNVTNINGMFSKIKNSWKIPDKFK